MIKFNSPTLITITGPSASGKSYLHDVLVANGHAVKVRSVTSRSRREGEVDGVDYLFMTGPEIKHLGENGKLIEHNVFLGNHYGVTKDEFERVMSMDVPPVLIVDPNGVHTFEEVCIAQGIDILKLYTFTPQNVIMARLTDRKQRDLMAPIADVAAIEAAHAKRLENMREEQRWIHTNIWDAIVDGTDVARAFASLETAITWRNRKNETPRAFQGL